MTKKFWYPDSVSWRFGVALRGTATYDKIKLFCVTLQSILQGITKGLPHRVKDGIERLADKLAANVIDAEDAELEVLYGLKKALRTHPTLTIESRHSYEVTELLRQFGYASCLLQRIFFVFHRKRLNPPLNLNRMFNFPRQDSWLSTINRGLCRSHAQTLSL
jgi:hypothetical protein